MIASSRQVQVMCWVAYLVSLPASYALLPSEVGDSGKEIAKGAYIGLMLFVSGPLPWLLCGSMGAWVKRHPGLLSIPFKPYWLAPERAEATWARLDRQLLAMGWVLWAMMAGLQYQLVARHQATWPMVPDEMSSLGLALLVSLLLIGLWVQVRGWQVPPAEWAAFQSQAKVRESQRPWQRGRPDRHPASTMRRGHGQPR